MSQESLIELIKKQWTNSPSVKFLSLGELVRLRYNGHDVQVADLAIKLKNGKQQEMPVMKIIKKRAAYEQYLENREKKKEEARKEEGPPLPEVQLPDIQFPTLPD